MESPFRLLGQVYDEESGLSWTRFRCFDAETGRWLSADPLGLEGGLEAFGFDGPPTTIVDPLGLAGNPHVTPQIRKKIKDLKAGKDVEVSSYKEADAVLYGAFPNARKVRGGGNKPKELTDRQKDSFSLTRQDKAQQRAVYHKDYQKSRSKPGVLAGHEELPEGHEHQTTPHINVLTPEGDKATIYVREKKS